MRRIEGLSLLQTIVIRSSKSSSGSSVTLSICLRQNSNVVQAATRPAQGVQGHAHVAIVERDMEWWSGELCVHVLV